VLFRGHLADDERSVGDLRANLIEPVGPSLFSVTPRCCRTLRCGAGSRAAGDCLECTWQRQVSGVGTG
jgi:predicted nucleic acid binding AN1-type Zn finger protein